ncbi:hypothetical protein [Thermococcus sp.]|uniref:hypothetical protein n=1 Tax=Thermococcus sp. TaxID=35749 RepID=UPI0026295C59|nr:hypothetical protein [Thermococcus sp.]
MKKFYAVVGDEEYLLLDRNFEEAVVTFFLWNTTRVEKGELQPGTRIKVIELSFAYHQGLIENAEVSLFPVLRGEDLRNELRAYMKKPSTQKTLDAVIKG